MNHSLLRGLSDAVTASVTSLPPDAVLVLDEITFAGQLPSTALAGRCSMSNDRVGVAVKALVQERLISVFRGAEAELSIRLEGRSPVRGLPRSPAPALASPESTQLPPRARSHREGMPGGRDQFPVGVELLTTRAQLRDAVAEIALAARKEVISVLAGPAPSAQTLLMSRQQDFELMRRRINVRVLYPREYAGLAHVIRYARELTAAGAEVRFADRLPHRLLTFDRRVAVVPVDDAAAGHGALVVREAILARSLGYLARTMFRSGRPLDETVADVGKPLGPTALDRRVLTLMGSGLADAACAHRLGVTDRTFRRYVGSLMVRLGASCRFDAGVKAVEQGWI